MHYDFFDHQHTLADDQRVEWLRQQYESLLTQAFAEYGRKGRKVMRFLRESDFYTVPCRHHNFVGGNAWHQLETLVYALGSECPDAELSADFARWQPLWKDCFQMSIAVACLLHDICNAGYGGSVKVTYPDRIRPRHGRKSTYVLAEFLKFELMFDENMAIIHHQHKTEDELRLNTRSEEDFQKVWEMPLYHMTCICDELSIRRPLTEAQLRQSVSSLLGSASDEK